MPLSDKQREYLLHADRRWNIKVGATRSGKTYCDYFLIPRRIRACRGEGIIVLLGNTGATLERNLLDPMRKIWGEELVPFPSSDNTVTLFGKPCYLLGAGLASQSAKLQGAGIEYAYGDEITTWAEPVFTMLKSRLDKPHSCFDGTCNPDAPTHWFKRFLDSGADCYLQSYTIDDNPFLSPSFVRSLKQEYAGTVYYDRFILGKWAAAEGSVYPQYAACPPDYQIASDDGRLKEINRIVVGVDFGGTRSGTAFVALGFCRQPGPLIALMSERHFGELDADRLCDRFGSFLIRLRDVYGSPTLAYCDNAEPVLIRSLRSGLKRLAIPLTLQGARKSAVNDRIRLTTRLFSQHRLFLTKDCETLSAALQSAVWNPRVPYDERLDDGTSDIDSLDAFEYTFEREAGRLFP